METTQETIIKNRTMSMTAVKDAQIMDCASFYKKHEKNLEWDEVENLSDFNHSNNPYWDGTHNDFLFKKI